LKRLKEQGIWKNVYHLLYHWHIYEAIKKHYALIFQQGYPKGKQ